MQTEATRYALVKIACIVRALKKQKEIKRAKEKYWLAFNQGIDIAIIECKDVMKEIEDYGE